ncbi:hypothetical protein PsorP6_009749 [Peronosclerospora sorghi]|uniref:Uncharacterized protein n=1 Tax=Peronosclerospora sorghi TaxID=230839 RepID=A0ACC0VZH0_9STRA|nr:hypothetical protein PsorP6_009749 [Peronosclerospora sorghi]
MEPSLGRAIHPSTKFESSATWCGCLLGSTYLLSMLLCAFLNVAFVLWPLTLFRHCFCLSIRTCRPVFCFVEGHFLAMLSGSLERIGHVRMVIAGDDKLAFEPQDHVLLVCNHRTEVDWIFFWNLALRLGVHDRIRIMTKSAMRYAPGVGWAMLLLEYPYVNRTWATDQERLTRAIASYKAADMGSWLAMFPEGTALYDKTLEASQKYAHLKGETSWEFVLQPRTKGFQLCVEKLEPEYIIDMTIAYPELLQGVRPSPLRFLKGQYPTEVHIHLKRYHRATFTKYKDQMGDWLKDRFREKDERLRRFYTTGAFEGKCCVRPDLPIWISVAPGIAFNVGLCSLALYLLITHSIATSTWLALTMVLSILHAHNFGN